MLHRYNVTLQVDDLDSCLSVVAKSAVQAREKAHHRWSKGLAFHTWKQSDIKVSKMESVNGPRMLFPGYLAGG